MSIEPITFVLQRDAAPAEGQLDYHPWGTRTLKVKVSAAEVTPNLRLRPKRLSDIGEEQFYALADDSDDFIVSWGGGHEKGPCVQAQDVVFFEKCVPMAPEDGFKMAFFNIRHVGPGDPPPSATLTLEAYDEEKSEVFASLQVLLRRPADYPQNPVRFEQRGDHWEAFGGHVLSYDPRWWPRDIAYRTSETLPIQARIDATTSNGVPRLDVLWGSKVIATISDHSKPSILSPEFASQNVISMEVFDFDEWHLALRIWFFWLDKKIGLGHEIPDAERFDLLVRRRDGRVTLACTDLHWRETWGEVMYEEETPGPFRATLGLTNTAKIRLIEEKVAEGLQSLKNLLSVLKREKETDHQRIYNPVDNFIPRKAESLGKDMRTRAPGPKAHLPTLENILRRDDLPPQMVSSDVRLG